jgi:hypothetical protein
MSFWESIPGIGTIFTTVKDIIRNFVRDPNDADKLAAEITSAFADIIKTELGSQHWLAANWRAIVMLLIALSLTIKTIFGIALAQIDYVLFGLLVMGLLGYKLDGKIIEFIAQLFKFGNQQARKNIEEKKS